MRARFVRLADRDDRRRAGQFRRALDAAQGRPALAVFAELVADAVPAELEAQPAVAVDVEPAVQFFRARRVADGLRAVEPPEGRRGDGADAAPARLVPGEVDRGAA